MTPLSLAPPPPPPLLSLSLSSSFSIWEEKFQYGMETFMSIVMIHLLVVVDNVNVNLYETSPML